MTDAMWYGEQEADVAAMAVDRTAGFLPARSSRLIADEDRVERMEARRAERERAERAERQHDRALASWKQQQELTGEQVSVQQILNGGAGVTVGEVLERARLQAEAQDEVAARWRPDGRAPDAVMFTDLMPEPAPAARSAAKLELVNRLRHWRDRVEARSRAEDLGAYPHERPSWSRP